MNLYYPIWAKFGVSDPQVMPLITCEFRENRRFYCGRKLNLICSCAVRPHVV